MRKYIIQDALGLISRYFGILLLIPIIVAIIYQEWYAIIAFLSASTVAFLFGFIKKSKKPDFSDIRRNEGILIVSLTWLLAAILGAIPYLFFNLGFLDALFESMSGITTTGATIFKDFTLYPKSLFFWRSFDQWLGGLGILVLFIAIFPQLAVAGRQLFFAEAPGPTEEKLTPRIRHTAVNLWSLYIGLTIIEIVLLSICGMPVFDSVCNSLSTLAAGGFSPNPESIMGYHSPILEWIVIVFMFLAGANFALQFRVLSFKKPKLLLQNSEFLLYSSIFLITTIVLTLMLFFNTDHELLKTLRISAFQTISILTTTGFATSDFANWSDNAKTILIILMFVGGCAGSSGGGIKVVRVLLLFKLPFKEILKAIHPRAVKLISLDKQIVSDEVMRQIGVFFIAYILLLLISTFLINIIESDMIVGFTASAATLGNIGPGFGIVGPFGSYADLQIPSKIILILNMWVGRLEIMTAIVLLSPYLWKGFVKEESTVGSDSYLSNAD